MPAQLHPEFFGQFFLVVLNHDDGTLGVYDASSLAHTATIPVVHNPDDVTILPNSQLAFVLSRTEPRLSVVDLRRNVLLSNLQLVGKPSDMILKPDGGELYVISPESHGLQVINTETHEVGDFVVLGDTPTRGVLSVDAGLLYVTDATANRVNAVDINNRRVIRTINGRELLISAGQTPDAIRFDPEENLLLVVNKGSSDLSVIRARLDDQSLLTMIPTGDRPQELAVKLF